MSCAAFPIGKDFPVNTAAVQAAIHPGAGPQLTNITFSLYEAGSPAGSPPLGTCAFDIVAGVLESGTVSARCGQRLALTSSLCHAASRDSVLALVLYVLC